ncbi:TraB/GumN family protein [Candidatus Nanohalovita haloferacivicina]|uniref:TraB/GumN family protein n=1 Tax=Candidatus Nanohalovita haloferacivicina TaxID=2978046 RepID=UPI00325FB124
MKKKIQIDDREITVIGTAHVSQESKEEVKNTIEEVRPDTVCVELDENRLKSLREESGWRELDVTEAIRNGDGKLLLMNLVLSIYQKQMGLEQDMKPGEELLQAIDTAEEKGLNYALVDQDINITLNRAMSSLGIWDKIKLMASLMVSSEEMSVEELKEDNLINALVDELDEEFPQLSRVFLHERNTYMAEKILEQDFEKAVVVVGAAHMKGLIEELEKEKRDTDFPDVEGFPWMKAVSYGIPAFILLGLGYSFFQIGFSTGINATKFWILSNGILAMLGAIIARSHVSTWIVSFLAAPLTSLDPALGAGMVASYAEAKLHPPTVEELESITEVTRYRDLWGNQVGRILLTFGFVTIGSALATFVSAGYIASLIG